MRYMFLRFPEGKGKAVTLSYDDGVEADKRFSDRITKSGLKCTFNLNNDALRPQALSVDDVKNYFLERGHEIAVHGAMHIAHGALRPAEGIRDVLDCRLELERKHGIFVRGMAYPDTGITRFTNGVKYEDIRQYLTELDIMYARTLGGDNNSFMMPADWHAWMPTAHHNNPKLMEYIDEFNGITPDECWYSVRHPRLFYLWGHSYEFDRDNNWERLDEICEKLGGREDVWYATNMEICEYVKAYESLVMSADSTKVYNPTLYDIWFNTEKQNYVVKSGETLHID